MKAKATAKKEKIHICDMSGKSQSRKVKELTRDPQYMCFSCNRSAHAPESLCNPVSVFELTGGV
jgi:hypothetical protein